MMFEERLEGESEAEWERVSDALQGLRQAGLEVDFERLADGTWAAAVRRIDSVSGAFPIGVGATRADAIEDARRRVSANERRHG